MFELTSKPDTIGALPPDEEFDKELLGVFKVKKVAKLKTPTALKPNLAQK